MWAAIATNYIDRANLSAAALSLTEDFHLTSGEMGIVPSAFFNIDVARDQAINPCGFLRLWLGLRP